MITETMPKSIFAPRPDDSPPLSNQKRIEEEVLHLKTRGGAWTRRRFINVLRGVLIAALATIVLLYFAEPFIYAYKKDQAFRSYLYLKHYGSAEQAQALAASPILTDKDVRFLDRRVGDFRGYFGTPTQAQNTANSVLAYTGTLQAIEDGEVADADVFARLRYNIFNRWGLIPPNSWRMLNPDPQTYGVDPATVSTPANNRDNMYRTKKSKAWSL